ncbi:MAG: hypothetical protein FWC57_01685, partial [Endomicrobia bacterium]|nr:hypothetical protein [Endomicrobiia bacterium]
KIAELVSIGMITAEQILSGDFLPGSLVGKFLRKHTGYRTGTEDTQKTYREGLVYIVTETLIATNYSTIIDELAKASVAPHKKWNKEHSGAPLATNEGVSLGKVIADTVQELALIADNPASDSAAEIKAIDFVNSSETTFGILLLKESLRPGDLDAIHEIWMGLYYAMKIVNRNRPLNYVIDEDPLGRRIKSLWSNAGSVLAKNGRPEKVVAGIVTEFDIWASHSVNRIKEQNDAAAKTKKGWLSSPIAWIITGISVLFPANLFASNADSIRHILNNEQLTFYTALVLFVVAVVGIFAYAVKTLADLPARQEKESVSSAVQQVNTRIVAEELEKVNRFFVDAERTKERYTEPGVVIVNLEANKSAFGDLSERLAKILGKDAYIIDPKYYHLSVSNAGNVSNEPASQDEVQKVISEIPNEFFEALSKVGGKLKGRFDITTGGQIVYVLDTNSEIPQGFFEAVKKYLPANWSRYDMVRMNLARMYPGVSQEKVKAVADLLNKWNEKNTVSDEVLNGRIVYGQVKSLGEITGEAYSRTYLGAALADFKGRNGYQTHKRDNGEFRSARSIDEMLKTINELSANNIDY